MEKLIKLLHYVAQPDSALLNALCKLPVRILKSSLPIEYIETCTTCGKVILRPYIAGRSEADTLCKACIIKEDQMGTLESKWLIVVSCFTVLIGVTTTTVVYATVGVLAQGAPWPFSFAETLTLIGVLTTSIIGIINAFKVKEVHTLVNRNFSEQKQQISELEAQLNSAKLTMASSEETRKVLAEEAKAIVVAITKDPIIVKP